jgi:hypothetical protein
MREIVNLLFNNTYIEINLETGLDPKTECSKIELEASYMLKSGINEIVSKTYASEVNTKQYDQCMLWLPILLTKLKNTTFLDDIFIFNKYNTGFEYRFRIEL